MNMTSTSALAAGWSTFSHRQVLTSRVLYLARCKALGFDVIEISIGFLSLPGDDWLRLVDRVHKAGMEANPELDIQFGAGGDTGASWKALAREIQPNSSEWHIGSWKLAWNA
jgi:phosphosulfolactate synthase (CoM biosynthesis protein A)